MNYFDSINGLNLEMEMALIGMGISMPTLDSKQKFIILSGIQADIQSKWKPLLMVKEIFLKIHLAYIYIHLIKGTYIHMYMYSRKLAKETYV